jgi:hypothetical protein
VTQFSTVNLETALTSSHMSIRAAARLYQKFLAAFLAELAPAYIAA